MATRLYIGNLSYQTMDDDLRQLFSEAGEVASATVITERDSGRSKGFGFVEMANDADAQKAVSMFDGTMLGDRNIKVDIARPREERAPGGGGGGYRGGGGGRRDRGGRGGGRRGY
jgi:RNA recognition motif-containing protein